MARSVVEQLKALDEQRGKLLAGAKDDALRAAQEAVDELNALGFSYILTDRRGALGSRKATRQVSADKPCPICKFQTIPPHDARRHRGQGEKKRAFSADELSAMGMGKAG